MKTANINFRAGNVQNLILFRKFEDFIIYFEPRIEKFPHYEHFALETDIKNCLHRIIELIKGEVKAEKFCKSIASMCGHAVHTDNYMFYVRQLLKVIRFLLGCQS
jgi:trehalose utilization protein